MDRSADSAELRGLIKQREEPLREDEVITDLVQQQVPLGQAEIPIARAPVYGRWRADAPWADGLHDKWNSLLPRNSRGDAKRFQA